MLPEYRWEESRLFSTTLVESWCEMHTADKRTARGATECHPMRTCSLARSDTLRFWACHLAEEQHTGDKLILGIRRWCAPLHPVVERSVPVGACSSAQTMPCGPVHTRAFDTSGRTTVWHDRRPM